MRFGDDRIPRSDGCRKITAGDCIKRQWEIVGTNHKHRPDRPAAARQINLRINNRISPNLTFGCVGGQTQLTGCPRHFDFLQTSRHWQARFIFGSGTNRFRVRVQVVGVGP